MLEIEESAEAVAPLHVGGRALRRCCALQKAVVESLMVSLVVVVLDVLPREEAQVAFTERDQSIEAFLFDRPNESSSGGESHPSALTEPDVRLSPHPAPTIQPPA
jgi:hypothetical protein